MTWHRDEIGPHLQLSEPINPASFESAHSLLECVVDMHEGPILQWPEACHLPLACWQLAEN